MANSINSSGVRKLVAFDLTGSFLGSSNCFENNYLPNRLERDKLRRGVFRRTIDMHFFIDSVTMFWKMLNQYKICEFISVEPKIYG